MTSNTAPSPNFTGINFNTDFFPSAVGEFVEYPVAQGPTTIATLYSSVIDTLSSGTAFNLLNSLVANLNIAINGGAGQTIRIGATTGASVHCANIDHQGNSINNSTNASGGTINLCNNMTSGTLNIGTNTTRSGNVNIGNGVGATGSVFIGSSTAPTTVGSLTTTGLTISQPLTLPTVSTTPTSTQLGYITSGTSGTTASSAIGTGGFNIITITNLAIGIYVVTFQATLDTFSLTTGMFVQPSTITTGGITVSLGTPQSPGSVTTAAIVLTGYIVCSTGTNTLNFRMATSAGTCRCLGSSYHVIKIA